MILEVLDGREGGVRTRIRLDRLPLTVGRGYDNDLILDDPYVDPHHARIALDETGTLVVEDLGSINGLMANGSRPRPERVAAHGGLQVRLGRTTLRFRDPNDPVPPAMIDASSTNATPLARCLSTLPGRLAVSAGAIGMVAAFTWLGNFQRSAASDVVDTALGFAILGTVWAGIWAIASRITVHRFHFVGHFAILSAVVLVGVAVAAVDEWAAFLFPQTAIPAVTGTVALLALVAWIVSGHLALASAMTRRRRWRIGIAISAVLLALTGTAALAEDDSFSDVPEFSGMLKPLDPHLLPTGTVDEFGQVAAELKAEVDALASTE